MKWPNRFLLLFLGFGSLTLQARNLTILSRSNLSNFELLDVELVGDRAYIPGGLGGLNIVDVSDPSHPVVLGEYSAADCAWGRLYAWAVAGDFAFGAGRDCGLQIINVADVSHPVRVGDYRDAAVPNTRYEHPAIQGNRLYAARHQDGVEVLDIADPGAPIQRAVVATGNAWATLPAGPTLYIADGKYGLKIADISNPDFPSVISSLPTTGTVKDLAYRSPFVFLAVGAAGVDMVDVSNPVQPVLVMNVPTGGYASRVSVEDSLLAVSNWKDVIVFRIDSTGLTLTGRKNTGGRIMAVALQGTTLYTAEWRQLAVLAYGPIAGADVDMSRRQVAFPRTDPGDTAMDRVEVTNSGQAELIISDLQPNNENYTFSFFPSVLPPGESADLVVSYSPQDGHWQSVATLQSNDTDESVVSLELRGNYPFGPMPGDPAPDFTLTQINGSGEVSLTSLLGQPTVIAFFTGW